MTEGQFQTFCKVIYGVTVMTLALQVVACTIMLWMAWHELPRHKDIMMLLGGSVFLSWGHLTLKKTFFKREEVSFGVYGPIGIMHSLGINLFWWCSYHFFELFFVLWALWLYLKTVWL